MPAKDFIRVRCLVLSGLVQHKMVKLQSHLKINWELYIMSMKCDLMTDADVSYAVRDFV